MTLLTKVGKIAAPLAGAVFIEPLLHLFAPSIKPLVRQFIQSDEVGQFMNALAEGTAEASSGVCTEFLASHAEKLLSALRKTPKLDEALLAALIQALADMRNDLRKKTQHDILNSFDQFFMDWDQRLRQIQQDGFLRRELLEGKQFADLFYEWPRTGAEHQVWWAPVKAELEAWTTFASIPSELEEYLRANLVPFANNALTSTLDREEYKASWNEFQKSVGTQILSALGQLETHVLGLNALIKVSGGQFIIDNRSVEFPLRKSVDYLVEDLATREIYIRREGMIFEEESVKIGGLQDFASRDGYFILAAPAGSGKSTLMARWIREFQLAQGTSSQRPTSKLCYHFYSKQEGTSDYNKGLTILSDQLLKALHIQANVNSFNPATIDSVISHSLELDHPDRLIVIIDGLDEAGEPSTETEFLSLFKRRFPPRLGENTTVILTVRDNEGADSVQHYRSEFGLSLNAIKVQEVTTDALASYLADAANINLKARAQQHDFLNLIITKTGGLAIYVHYLLDELANIDEARWNEVIEALPEGFEKYVSTSLPAALNGEPHWEDALSFVALTQAPLSERDLIALTQVSGNRLKKADFDRISWNIKRWLRSEQDTWAFSHQKIGEVFYELYVADVRQLYVHSLLAYCANWKQHQSIYVLQNYADILQHEQRVDELYELAGDSEYLDLQRTKLFYYPGARLRTFQMALLSAAASDNAAQMARFSLMHAVTVREMSVETWLEAYDSRGLLGTLELADGFGDPQRRIVWYLLIAWKLAGEGKKKETEAVLKRLDATPFPRLPTHLYFIAEIILPGLFTAANPSLLKSLYIKATSESYINSAHAAVPWFLSQYTFPQVRAEQPPDNAQAGRVPQFDEEGPVIDIDEAEGAARSLSDPRDRSEALGKLVVDSARSGQLAKAIALFDEAVRDARTIEGIPHHNTSLGNLVTALAYPTLLGKAKEFLETIKGPMGVNPKLVIRLAAALVRDGHLSEAEQVGGWIKDAWSRCQVLIDVTVALLNAQRHAQAEALCDEAIRTAHTIVDPGARSDALSHIASVLAYSQQSDKAGEVFDHAIQAASSLENPTSLYYTLKGMAKTLFYLGFAKRAQQVLATIQYDEQSSDGDGDVIDSIALIQSLDNVDQLFNKSKQSVDSVNAHGLSSADLTSLAVALAQIKQYDHAAELFNEAERIASRIQESVSKAQALKGIVVALAHAKYFDKAARMAGSIKLPEVRNETLWRISAVLANAKRFSEAQQAALAIKDPKFRTQALGHLAATLLQENRYGEARELYTKARTAYFNIRETWFRSIALKYVAKVLADNVIASEIEKALSITHYLSRDRALMHIAAALSHNQRFEDARRVADLIKVPRLRCGGLGECAASLIDAEQVDEGKALFGEAERIAQSIEDFESRSKALGYLAVALAKARLFSEALRVAKEVTGSNLLTVLDSCARAGISKGLKQHLIALSYEINSAAQLCAQMTLLYETQVDDVYNEFRRYI